MYRHLTAATLAALALASASTAAPPPDNPDGTVGKVTDFSAYSYTTTDVRGWVRFRCVVPENTDQRTCHVIGLTRAGVRAVVAGWLR